MQIVLRLDDKYLKTVAIIEDLSYEPQDW